jgi:prolyl oligopeptidase
MRAKLLILLVLLGAMFSGAQAVTNDDPYAWLEDVHGAKPLAWVAEQNGKSLGALKSDPRYQKNYDNILSVLDATDRIPFGSLDHGYVYNFWQDAQNPKGLWRRTRIADYESAAPHWQLLLDVDALAKSEKQNWVFAGAECAPGQTRCLIRLSRGGGDAVVIREYDLKALKLATDGFSLPEGKADATYLNDDTVLFATAADGATNSGYARIVRQWQRGTPVTAARTLYEGEKTDVGASASVFHSSDGDFAVIVRSVSFFETDYFAVEKAGVKKLPLPRFASLQGVQIGDLTHMIVTLRQDWAQGGKTFKKGALVSLTLDSFLKSGKEPFVQALYTPDMRGSVEQVGISGNSVFAAITENVIGIVRQFTYGDVDGDQWVHQDIALPKGGAVGIVSTDEYHSSGTDAYFTYQGYLTPPTLYALDTSRDAPPKPIKSLPARFDASGLVTEQFEATSKDGTKVPYFVTRPKSLSGPAPTLLYGYGGFEVSLTPSYSANFGRLWLSHGGIYVVANIRGGC